MNEEMYLNRILYNKVIDVIKDKRIVLTMLQPKYFRKTIEEFIECVEASNINNCIALVYKILKDYYSSKLYEENYYSDKKVMSFLNQILSLDVIKNKNSYGKMLDLYDIIIKKNTTCCRFSYDEKYCIHTEGSQGHRTDSKRTVASSNDILYRTLYRTACY